MGFSPVPREDLLLIRLYNASIFWRTLSNILLALPSPYPEYHNRTL